MPKKLRKSLRIYFSKLKRIPSLTPPSSHSLLSACKYPKTPSFSAPDRHVSPNPNTAATLSDVDRFLQENFHSLYLHDNDSNDDHENHSAKVNNNNNNNSSSASSSSTELQAVPGDGMAVTTFSKDPYGDFRDSMEEMVEARHKGGELPTLDWDFMEEMLFCYLELNDRSVHKYILKAFTDLAVGFQRRRAVKRKGRRRRGSGVGLTEMAPREKVKECYYS